MSVASRRLKKGTACHKCGGTIPRRKRGVRYCKSCGFAPKHGMNRSGHIHSVHYLEIEGLS